MISEQIGEENGSCEVFFECCLFGFMLYAWLNLKNKEMIQSDEEDFLFKVTGS